MSFDHPSWCRCKDCQAEDRLEEEAALKGVPVQEPEPPAVPAFDLYILTGEPILPVREPSDYRRELADKRMREAEPAERAALGYFP